MDILTREQRAHCMSRVRGKDTKPELVVRRMLHGMGYRFRLHGKKLPGRPDIVLTRHRKVVFVHGCFWHRHNCPRGASTPTSNVETWNEKFARNLERDRTATRELRSRGWDPLIVWECQTRASKLSRLQKRLLKFLKG